MKHIFFCLIALTLLVGTSTLFGQQVNSVTHVPNPAYSGNPVTLKMNIKLWPHTYLMGHFVNWSGNYAYIYLNFDYNPPTPWMPGIVADIDYDVDLGALNAGNYVVRVVDFDNGSLLYTYNFSVQTGCNPPTLSQLAVSNSSCTSATLQCNVSGVSSYGYRYRPVNSSTWTTVNSTPYNYLNITNLLSNTQYVFQARVWCGSTSSNWSADKYFFTCQNNGSGTCANPYFAFCGNTYTGTNAAGTNNYNSYGTLFTQMYGPEVVYQLTLTQPGPLTLMLTGMAYNQDLDLIVLSSCNTNAIVAYSGNSGNNNEYINVGYLAAGTYRIVIDGWNYSVSNYTLTVQCNNYSCQAPATSQLFTTNITSYSARINCNYSGASGFDWRYRAVGSSNWIDLVAGSASYADLSGLTPNTMYEFQCAVLCGGAWTLWSNSQYFNTAGISSGILPNDEHCDAIQLIPNSSCYLLSGTNIGATESVYPSAPSGECYTVGMRDVWYKVQVPYTGSVKISTFAGTLSDAVVAFYYGSCNKLTAGKPSCFDVTNGDEMPDVTINGTPGEWWYIRVWGYGGATGTFYICAQTVTNLVEDENTVGKKSGGTDDRSAEEQTQMEKSNGLEADTYKYKLTLYPVPANDYITCSVELEVEIELDIRVFDLNGKLMTERTQLQGNAGSFSEQLDVSELPQGMYILRVTIGQQEVVKKFMKQ